MPISSLVRDAPFDIWGGGAIEFYVLLRTLPFGVFFWSTYFSSISTTNFFFPPTFSTNFFFWPLLRQTGFFNFFLGPLPPDIKWCVPKLFAMFTFAGTVVVAVIKERTKWHNDLCNTLIRMFIIVRENKKKSWNKFLTSIPFTRVLYKNWTRHPQSFTHSS